MTYPVKLSLFKNNRLLHEFLAENERDLNCPIEMDAGTGWLDAAGLYQKLLEKRKPVTEIFTVCNSFEKWGSMQQEVVRIKVRMEHLKDSPTMRPEGKDSDASRSASSPKSRPSHAGWIHRLIDSSPSHTIYFIVIGMVLSALSLCLPFFLEK